MSSTGKNTHPTPTELKLALQKTSIYLGSDDTDYVTQEQRRQAEIAGKYCKIDTLEMQAELQASHLCLEHGEEKDEWTTTNTLLDAREHGGMEKYRGKLNTAAMQMLRTSSLHFGNDKTHYESIATSANNLDWAAAKGGVRTAEMKRMKQELSATNYVLGDEKPDYSTCMVDDFQLSVATGARPAALDPACAKDLRASHFDTGVEGEGGDFTTSNALADPTGRIHEFTGVLNEQAKKQLLQSSVTFGDDKTDYSSTAQRAQMENPASAFVEPYNRDHHIQYD